MKKSLKIFAAAAGILGLLYFTIHVLESFQYPSKVRQQEAKGGLGVVYTFALTQKEKTKTYEVGDISAFDYRPLGARRRYSFWYAVNGVPTAIPLPSNGQYVTGPCDVTTPPTTVRVAASRTGFVAAAKGNIDEDATCDEWSINEARELKHTLDDLHR
jgi:hypothetical protein